jgi:hypothetical protein
VRPGADAIVGQLGEAVEQLRNVLVATIATHHPNHPNEISLRNTSLAVPSYRTSIAYTR